MNLFDISENKSNNEGEHSLNQQHVYQLVQKLQDHQSGNFQSDGPAARVHPACATHRDRSEHELKLRCRR